MCKVLKVIRLPEEDEVEKKSKEIMDKLTAGKITSVTIGIGRRCPHCGELPEAFRTSFTRIVELLYIVPEKSQHLSDGPKGVFEYKPDKDCVSPSGRYPAVIVPKYLVGKKIKIDVE
jgi:hypothetical protein